MGLTELQNAICDAVFAGARGGDAASVGAHIAVRKGLTVDEHLDIYRNSIYAKLIRALREIYPVCQRLVGADFFTAMGTVFVRGYPSRSPNLGDYGEQFATFISTFEPASGLPYLPDVARLEWAWHRAFNAADDAPLDIRALDAVAEADRDRIVYRLPVSATLFSSPYPVHRIWEANQDDAEPHGVIDIDDGGVRLIVWRQGFDLRIDPLNDGEWQLLSAVDAGCRFAELFDEPMAENVVGLLPRCVARGWLAGFTLGDVASN
jgi:hypothetical protein